MGDYAAAAPAIVGLLFGIGALVTAKLAHRRYMADRAAAEKSKAAR